MELNDIRTPGGLRLLRSSRGFLIAVAHYSADGKGQDWVLAERPKYARQEDWNREQEVDFRSVVGTPAYPNWSDAIHIDPAVHLIDRLPLAVACDFNVDPCIFAICQLVRGAYLHVLEEIVQGPTSIDAMVQELRNRYPTHTAELIFYGDATGSGRSVQTAAGHWDLVRLHMAGYPVPVSYRVPPANPPVNERLAAMAARLKDGQGRSWVRVHPSCREVIADGNEVVLNDQGTKEYQTFDRADPYHRRTHAMSAVGYLICREWPLPVTLGRQQRQPAKPRRYGRLLGSA